MLRELMNSSMYYHAEYLRRHVRISEPPERARRELRRTIGMTLIHMGERLAGGEESPQFDQAA